MLDAVLAALLLERGVAAEALHLSLGSVSREAGANAVNAIADGEVSELRGAVAQGARQVESLRDKGLLTHMRKVYSSLGSCMLIGQPVFFVFCVPPSLTC